MKEEIVELKEDLSGSHLYSEDLAPTPKNQRTWNMWHLAALWVGMAVCIPTYLLASYMIMDGMGWLEALIIIGLANLIVTVPMVLNGHAGVKYGIPFPVIGRSSFGIKGIHIPAMVRGIVACGWFGIQTWIGGLAVYAMFCALTGMEGAAGLSFGKFAGFAIFWLINMFFIWRGTESIKFLEQYSAPILLFMGIFLIGWGATGAGGFGIVLQQSEQMQRPVAEVYEEKGQLLLQINPIKDKEGKAKAEEYRLNGGPWIPLSSYPIGLANELRTGDLPELKIQVRKKSEDGYITSSEASAVRRTEDGIGFGKRFWKYILALTAMVGFWATMSLSIADITRYAATQKAQIAGQFIGLPGTMMLYSFVGIFVTCAALINFDDILIGSDAPWDPVSLLAKFKSPAVVIVAQLFMIVATLSTNIAANVIAPSNAFSNLAPKAISFRMGGLITGIIGIIICPWWIMDEIMGLLLFVSGLLGPVLGIMLADYFLIRKKNIQLAELYKPQGAYSYTSGFNIAAIIALFVGILVAIIGYFVPALEALYNLSWFSGFLVSFVLYFILMKNNSNNKIN